MHKLHNYLNTCSIYLVRSSYMLFCQLNLKCVCFDSSTSFCFGLQFFFWSSLTHQWSQDMEKVSWFDWLQFHWAWWRSKCSVCNVLWGVSVGWVLHSFTIGLEISSTKQGWLEGCTTKELAQPTPCYFKGDVFTCFYHVFLVGWYFQLVGHQSLTFHQWPTFKTVWGIT